MKSASRTTTQLRGPGTLLRPAEALAAYGKANRPAAQRVRAKQFPDRADPACPRHRQKVCLRKITQRVRWPRTDIDRCCLVNGRAFRSPRSQLSLGGFDRPLCSRGGRTSPELFQKQRPERWFATIVRRGQPQNPREDVSEKCRSISICSVRGNRRNS